MPKRIENLREAILSAAKEALLAEGYDKLSLRGVARQCGVAVGTLYNYFPSKLDMTAAIMLDDWKDRLARMNSGCGQASSVEDGIRSIYSNLREYALLYQDTWNMAISSKEVREELANGRSRHLMLVEQLERVVGKLFERFGVSCGPFLPNFIATSLLAYILIPDFDYEPLGEVYKKLI